MKTVSKSGLFAVLVALIAAAPAFAQEIGAPTTGPAQMMQDQGMMGNGDMQGMGNMQSMMAMMQMMQQMGPMMEAMATQPATPAPLPEKG